MAPQDHLPLSSIELLLLTMLAAGERHGYGLRQDILDYTDGKIEIEAGNLYRHMRSLEDHDLIATTRAPRQETDERRIYYKLTSLGRRVLAGEMIRLRALVRLAEERGIIAPVPA
jgi:DNA-binding PadR family transcriptional regulator